MGITGVLCYFLLIDGSDTLSDYARGFYLGGASGISIGSVFLIYTDTSRSIMYMLVFRRILDIQIHSATVGRIGIPGTVFLFRIAL